MQSPPETSDVRDLSAQERHLVEGMLIRGSPDSVRYLEQLARIHVVSNCTCGCASINFALVGCAPPAGPMRVIADFLYGDDSSLCGAFQFEQDGVLAGLEVYGLAVQAPKALPRLED